MKFKYFSNYSGDFNVREVEPIGLTFYGGNWHLLAYCRLREAPRDFRVDRLVKLTIKEETFEVDNNRVSDFMKQITQGNELSEMIIGVDKRVVRFISNQKFYQGFVSEEEKDDCIEMTFLVPSEEYFSRWLVSLGDSVKIIEPESLKSTMLNLAEELITHYKR